MFIKFLTAYGVLSLFLCNVNAECGVCGSKEYACVNSTSYYFCDAEQKQYGSLKTCEMGYVCGSAGKCVTTKMTDQIDCIDPNSQSSTSHDSEVSYNQCNTTTQVLCLSSTRYSTCGNTKPIISTCPLNTICDNSKQFPCITGTLDKEKICEFGTLNCKLPHGNQKKYFYCYKSHQKYDCKEMSCPGKLVFSPERLLCVEQL